MGTWCRGAKVWLVAGLAILVASWTCALAQEIATNMDPADDAPLIPCALASPGESLRCEMKRGLPFTWVGHPPSSLREVYVRLMRQGRLPQNALLAVDLKRAPFRPWAGKRSGSIPPALSVFHIGEEQPFSRLEESEEEDEMQEEWTTLLDAAATLPSLERAEVAATLVPLLPSAAGHVRVRRSTEEQPHTQVDSYKRESRKPMFQPWGGKRSGVERGRLEDVLQEWTTERGSDSMAWPAVAVNPGLAANMRINADMKRKAFSAWAGKRNDDAKRGGFSAWAGKRSNSEQRRAFSAWAGKRDAFNPWRGKKTDDEKRQAFSAWAGKRSNNDDDKREAFNAWAGKRSDNNDDKRQAFNAWAGKRSDNDNEKRQGFSAWAGKRSDNDNEKRQAFSAWAGKRSDNDNEKRQAFNAWAGKRSDNDNEKRQAFSAWAGKRSNNDNEKRQAFNAWAGKRSNNNDDKRQAFSAWAGKRSNKDDDKRQAFNAWAGKRSDDDNDKNQAFDKRQAFNAWAGKRQTFNAWGGKRSGEDKGQASSVWMEKYNNKEKRDNFIPWERDGALPSSESGAWLERWPTTSSHLYYFHPWLGKRSLQGQGEENEKSRGQISSLLQPQQEHQQASQLLNHSPDSLTANWDR